MHTGKTYLCLSVRAEDIPHTWQHWLKIAQKPLVLHYRIFPPHALDPRPLWSRFNVSSLPGYLVLNSIIFLNLKDDITSALLIIFPFLSLLVYTFQLVSSAFANQLQMDFFRLAQQGFTSTLFVLLLLMQTY